MKEKELDTTDFGAKEIKTILERIEQLLNDSIDKVTYKNKMLYLTTKKSTIVFSFSEVLLGDGYCLSRVTIFDNVWNVITGISKEHENLFIWEKIDQKLIDKYIEEIGKHKIPVNDVLELLS